MEWLINHNPREGSEATEHGTNQEFLPDTMDRAHLKDVREDSREGIGFNYNSGSTASQGGLQRIGTGSTASQGRPDLQSGTGSTASQVGPDISGSIECLP